MSFLNERATKYLLTGYLTLLFGGNLLECTNREIDRVGVRAGRAIISDSDRNGLAVLGVGKVDLLAAEGGLLARVSITVLICHTCQ